MKTQNQRVLAYLKKGFTLTQDQALFYWKVKRLAARIYDLRSQGHEIVAHRVNDRRDVRYSLVK